MLRAVNYSFILTFVGYVIFSLVPTLLTSFGGGWVVYLYNIFSYLGFLLAMIAILLIGRIALVNMVYLYVPIAILSILWGAYNFEITLTSFRHVYLLGLPLVGYVFGKMLCDRSQDNLETLPRHIYSSRYFMSLLVLIYAMLYFSGFIEYFGASSGACFLVAAALHNSKLKVAVLMVALVLLTGKRSEILAAFTLLYTYMYFNSDRKFIFHLLGVIIVPTLILVINTVLPSVGKRFFVIFDSLFPFDAQYFNVATSGRFNDVLNGLSTLPSLDYWFLGSGIGFSWFLDEGYLVYYSHFTPLSYFLLGGISMFFLVFYMMAKIVIQMKYHYSNFYFLSALYFIVVGILGGASMFTSVFAWFTFGVCSSIAKKRIN